MRTARIKTFTLKFYRDWILVPQRFFLITAIVFGLPIMLLRPGFDVPDFNTHFKRSFDIAHGNLVADQLPSNPTGVKLFGGYFPKDVDTLITHVYEKDKLGKKHFGLYDDEYVYDEPRALDYNTVAVYNPLSYGVNVAGVLAGRALNVSLYGMVLVMSLLNFLVWLAAIFYAIKITPIGKLLFVVLNLLPMTLFLTTSINPDTFMFAAVFLFIALNLSLLAAKRDVTGRQLAYLVALAVLLAALKQTYFILAFLPLVLYKQLGSRQMMLRKFSLLIGLPLLVTFAWSVVLRSQDIVIREGADPAGQIPFILHHPHALVKAYLNTALFGLDGTVWSVFGVLGWLDKQIPLWSAFLAFSAMFYAVLGDTARLVLDRWQRAVFGLVFLANIFLILLALYLYWTPVGGGIIEGLQGRYFIPLVPLLLPFILPRKKLNVVLPLNRHGLYVPVAVTVVLAAASVIMAKAYYPGFWGQF